MTDSELKWHYRFLGIANQVSLWSKDRSTSVGALLIGDNKSPITFAYNGFPRGVDDNIEERHERPLKYSYTSHAEENAICNAAQLGVSTKGTTLYVTFHPCSGCARKIIQAGIKKVVCYGATEDFLLRWKEDMKISKKMFEESGVDVIELSRTS